MMGGRHCWVYDDIKGMNCEIPASYKVILGTLTGLVVGVALFYLPVSRAEKLGATRAEKTLAQDPVVSGVKSPPEASSVSQVER